MANEPRGIWQSQAGEKVRMTEEMMFRRAEELRAKTRVQRLVAMLLPVIITLLCWRSLTGRLHFAPLAVVAWSLAGSYLLQRGIGNVPATGDLSALDFYRLELERQQTWFRRVLLWFFGPVISAIGVFLASITGTALGENLPKAAPFLIVVLVWAVAFLVIRIKEQRALTFELKNLE